MAVPSLPTELWIIIIRYASEVPGALYTSSLPPMEDAPRAWTVGKASDPFRLFPPPKKAPYVRISRALREISIPFVYEHVRLSQPHQQIPYILRSFIERAGPPLAHSNTSAILNPRRYWLHTKRLDIIFPPLNAEWVAKEIQQSLASLSRFCPNLRILAFQFRRGRLNLVDRILYPLIPNVRNLCLLEIHCPSNLLYLPISAQSLPLEVLVLDTPNTRNAGLNLPKVHTLCLYSGHKGAESREIHRWSLPALRCLMLGVDFAIYAWEPLFNVYGPQITSLDLRLSTRTPIFDVLNRCTSLEELTIKCSSIAESNRGVQSETTPLKRILLYFFSGAPGVSLGTLIYELNVCMQLLWRLDVPHLQYLRFLDVDDAALYDTVSVCGADSIQQSRYLQDVRYYIEYWTKNGVRLEGKAGDPITVPVDIDGSAWVSEGPTT
jgi:hypothetical protein